MKKQGAERPERSMDDPLVRARLESALDRLLKECALVDIRSTAEFEARHIRGSLSVPLGPGTGSLSQEIDTMLAHAKGRPIAVIAGDPEAAEAGLLRLHAAGLGSRAPRGVHALEGGFQAWCAMGMPLAPRRVSAQCEARLPSAMGQ